MPENLFSSALAGRIQVALASTVVALSAIVWLGGLAATGTDLSFGAFADGALIDLLKAATSWTAAWVALGCVFAALILVVSASSTQDNKEAALIAVSMAGAAVLDALAAVALARQGLATASPAGPAIAIWTLSRTYLAAALMLGGMWISRARTTRFLTRALGSIGAVAAAAGIAALVGAPLPPMSAYGAIAPHPWDLLALVLFAMAGLVVLPHLVRVRRTALGRALMLSTVPHVLSQIDAAFGGSPAFEGHSMVSHLLRLIAYGGIAGALALNLLSRVRSVSITHREFETTRRELSRQTEELVRVDRERILEEAKRRRAERRLLMLERAVERMSIGVVITEPDGTLLYVNPAGASMHGYSTSDLIGTRYQLLAPDGEPAGASTATPPTGRPWVREQMSRTRDGATFPARLVSDNVRDDAGNLLASVTCCEDISERRRVEQMKQDFISTVSHELRTPLTSIVAALGLIAQPALREDPERLHELTTVAHRNSHRLLQLVNDLLDLQRLSVGRMSLESMPVAIEPLLDETATGMRAVAHEHDVRIEAQCPQGLRAIADRRRLVQVLLNLISNAIKFSPPGAAVELSARGADERVILTVRDQGPGIPQAFQDQIFERFTQADASTARPTGGSGLGLAIARQLVEAMAGTVEFETEEGRGTAFHVNLPAGSPDG